MRETRRLLLVFGCAVCLLAVASALPAADPRLDAPGASDGEPIVGEWESMDETPDFSTDPPEDLDDDGDDDGNDDDDYPGDPEIEVRGAIEPGNEVTIDTDHFGPFSTRAIEVNGEEVAETDGSGNADVVVPYAEEMTVAVPEDGHERTVDVPTDAAIEPRDGAVPDREFDFSVAVGSTPVTDATVSLEGEAVATTDDEGRASVTLPETAGPADLHVERGPVEGERTIDVAEPDVEFASPLLFPGSPAPVQVSADGAGVPNATVALESGGEATTGDDGRTRLWLPIDDAATVTVEVGAEQATTSVDNLYLRLTALVVLVPGFLVGGTMTYLRLESDRRRRQRRATLGLFVGFGDLLAGLFDGLGRPSLSWPDRSITLPRLGGSLPSIGGALTSFGGALASFGSAFGTLASLGSFTRSSERSVGSLFRDRLGSASAGSDAASDDRDGTDAPTLADEPLTPRGPRAEIRAAWHAFLDRLGVANRETRTAGAVARRALAAGFPVAAVRRLVTVFRDVEYGDAEPSPERVAEARAAAAELIDHDDEEGSE